MQKAKGECPVTQKENVQNILKASLICLFSSNDAMIFLFVCPFCLYMSMFHMEIYKSTNINGRVLWIEEEMVKTKRQSKHLRTPFVSAVLLYKAILTLQHNKPNIVEHKLSCDFAKQRTH